MAGPTIYILRQLKDVNWRVCIKMTLPNGELEDHHTHILGQPNGAEKIDHSYVHECSIFVDSGATKDLMYAYKARAVRRCTEFQRRAGRIGFCCRPGRDVGVEGSVCACEAAAVSLTAPRQC